MQPPVVVRSNYGRPTRPKPDPSPRAPLAGAWDLYAASYALRGDERHAPAYFLAQNDRAALAIAAMGGARSWPDTLEDSKITAVDRSLVALALLTFAAHSDDQALLDLARQVAREMPIADALRALEALSGGTLHEGSNEDKPKTAPLSNLHVKQFYTKVRKHTQYLRSISSMWGHTGRLPQRRDTPGANH